MISDSERELVRLPDTKANLEVLAILASAQATALRSHRRRATLYVCLLMTITTFIPVRAEVTLPSIFSDGMVLQSGVPVPIWGKASPGEIVSAKFDNQIKIGKADVFGRWSVLPTGTMIASLVNVTFVLDDSNMRSLLLDSRTDQIFDPFQSKLTTLEIFDEY